jgi:hypothetical protein
MLCWKCVISCWKKQRKHRGMGWIKHQILEDQEGPFMFQNVLKVMLGNFLEKHDISLPIHLRLL